MNVIYCDKTPHENFRGKPLSEATNQTVKNEMQDAYLLLVELFCCVVLVSNVWLTQKICMYSFAIKNCVLFNLLCIFFSA